MKLSKTLWCVLVIIAFSMPAFAATPGQIDSFDDILNDINDANWIETTGDYMQQALVGGANEVNEGVGSMKFDFTTYTWPNKDSDVVRTFNPVLDFSNYKDLAITLWVWTDDPNDTRRGTFNSRLNKIALYDSTIDGPVGSYSVLPLKNIGWNKVVAPLRNFVWTEGQFDTPVDPCEILWDEITKINLWARTEDAGNHYAIYIDDMQLEWAPPQPARPYQIASCDDIVDEQWDELRGSGLMHQAELPGDSNFYEGTGSLMIDIENIGGSQWDLTPSFFFVPALDFTDANEWAVTMWVWTDLVDDSKINEIILHDVTAHLGRFRVPMGGLTEGWNKITARLDEFLWNNAGNDLETISPDDVSLDVITFVEMWVSCSWIPGNNIYIDDMRIEPAVEALSEAVVYNADYGTITVDGNAVDWADLVDSDSLDFDLQAIPEPNGNLHVNYRLAWDANFLYILVEEQSGDTEATEAANIGDFASDQYGSELLYDSLSLYFDFKNCRHPGVGSHVSFWLYLGLSSDERTDLMFSWINGKCNDQGGLDFDTLDNGSVATSGTLGSRVIEAKIKWSDLDDHIYPWLLPEGGLAAAVTAKPGSGYIFGCDPRLCDTEDESSPWTTEKGKGWLSGDPITNGQGRPSGRDTYSTDVRLVYSAGDIDFDRDVDFVDYAQFAAEWFETGCNNVNDFCNGADIIINGTVTLDDLARFTERWLD